MKILHVIRGLENSSGTTHIVGPLAEEQARLGHEVTIYFVEKSGSPVTPDPGLVRSRCFPLTAARGHPGISVPFAREILRTARTFDVMHIHAVWNFPTWFAMRAGVRSGLPFMVAPQGSLETWALDSGSRMRRLYAHNIEGPLLRRAARMQALTHREAEQIRAFGIDAPVSIIPNGVMPAWLGLPRRNLAHDLGLPPQSQTLLFLSRVHPKKGLDVLMRGFAQAYGGRPSVVLVVAGSDAGAGYLAAMQALAGELGLGDQIRFLGEVRGEQKQRILAGADAFALTSHSEGLPVAVVEAMACALPILITPGCNIPEVADADAGLIAPPDPDAVAAGLRALLSDAETMARRGVNGRRLVAEHFTWPQIARQAVAAYSAMTDTTGKVAA